MSQTKSRKGDFIVNMTSERAKVLSKTLAVIDSIVPGPRNIAFGKDTMSIMILDDNFGIFLQSKIKASFFTQYTVKTKDEVIAVSIGDFSRLLSDVEKTEEVNITKSENHLDFAFRKGSKKRGYQLITHSLDIEDYGETVQKAINLELPNKMTFTPGSFKQIWGDLNVAKDKTLNHVTFKLVNDKVLDVTLVKNAMDPIKAHMEYEKSSKKEDMISKISINQEEEGIQESSYDTDLLEKISALDSTDFSTEVEFNNLGPIRLNFDCVAYSTVFLYAPLDIEDDDDFDEEEQSSEESQEPTE